MPRLRIGRVTVALAAVGLTIVGAVGGALAEESNGSAGQYTVLGRADAFAVEYFNSGAPVAQDGQVFYATPSSAQSLLDSVGRSEAFASAPFPGDLAAGSISNGNGVLAGFGLPPVLPGYPFLVSSSHPGKPSSD